MTELLRVVIAGPSMAPTLEVGDVALVEPRRTAVPGEVIVFESRGAPICHRAILVVPWAGGARIVHLGDASTATPGVTSAAALIGRVVMRERAGQRTVVRWRRPRLAEVGRAIRALTSAARRSRRARGPRSAE